MTALDVRVEAKRFGGRLVLGPVAFSLAEGERAALLGPSGIGKSTLLSLVAGLDGSFDGSIRLAGGRVSMVFQSPRLLPWRTLTQNIALLPGSGGALRARELLAEVGLAEAADQYPEKVSLGMQRRAALARALAVEPDLLLMDEPLVSLDPASAAAMRELVTALLDRRGTTVLIATHDRREALMLCDRILQLDGPPARLASDTASPLDRQARLQADAVEAAHRDLFGA